MKFRTGVVIGKFLPPHRGHKFLIETALSQAEQVTVIVCEKRDDPIAGALRGAWLAEMHPAARVLVIDDVYDDQDSQLWAKLTIEWLGEVPDAAFTSEDYGVRWSHFMGCAHVQVDKARRAVPISATQIRRAPLRHWEFLEPPVRAHFARRVVVLGAESTGTTTLAQALAAHYATPWVAEYGREYCEKHWTGEDYEWQSAEFAHIAAEQARREDEAAREANKLLICDTNAFATRLWHERYKGFFCPQVEAIAARGRCNLYLLTGDEIPFVQDGLRDGEHIRHAMHQRFEAELRAQNTPWKLLRGPHEARLAQAIALIDALLSET